MRCHLAGAAIVDEVAEVIRVVGTDCLRMIALLSTSGRFVGERRSVNAKTANDIVEVRHGSS